MCRGQASRQPNDSIDAILTGDGHRHEGDGHIAWGHRRVRRQLHVAFVCLVGCIDFGPACWPAPPPFFGSTVRLASYRFVGLLVPPPLRYCLQGFRRAASSAMRFPARLAASSAPENNKFKYRPRNRPVEISWAAGGRAVGRAGGRPVANCSCGRTSATASKAA